MKNLITSLIQKGTNGGIFPGFQLIGAEAKGPFFLFYSLQRNSNRKHLFFLLPVPPELDIRVQKQEE